MPTVSPIKIDARAVVRVFGGATELRFRLERRGLGELSIEAISKWFKRERIPGEWLIALMLLARMERMRFSPLAFVNKGKPAAPRRLKPSERSAATRA